MTQPAKFAFRFFAVAIAFGLFATNLFAWEPNVNDLETAVHNADFTKYFTNLTTWIDQKASANPSGLTDAAASDLLKDPMFAAALSQRQFIAKVGAERLAGFAKIDESNKPFVLWLLKNRQALDLYLEGATPCKLSAREDNSWSISVNSLNILKRIYDADPDSHSGIYLRLAMATSFHPPGTGSPGSGQQKKPSDPVVRYTYFKKAHANKELFPSFDKLSVWEYQFVVDSGASEEDLTWGREMVKTWNPTLLENERVVDTTSSVWRRNSPVPHSDYKHVLDGGGKCGPRSSWSVFICQAFGIPAIGVGQPRHACVAYKGIDGTWHVAYGRGWNASKLEGMSGAEFVEGTETHAYPRVFSKVEHLRWLASAVSSKANVDAIHHIAAGISKSTPTIKRNLDASEKSEEMDAEPGAVAAKKSPASTTIAIQGLSKPTPKPEPPVSVAPGVMHIRAADYAQTGGITVWGGEPRVGVMDSYEGGKQIMFSQGMASCWTGYKVEVPETGVYELTAKVATVNSGQTLFVRSFGAMAEIKDAKVTNVFRNQVNALGGKFAIDNDPGTRWAVNMGVDKASIELNMGKPTPVSTIMIDERAYSMVAKFKFEYKVGDKWEQIFEGKTIGQDFAKDFPQVTGQYFRLSTLDCAGRTGGPTFWEISLGTMQDGHGWMELPWTAGLWQTTKPTELRLVKGSRMIWLFAPYQRSVSMKWLELKRKGDGSISSEKTPSNKAARQDQLTRKATVGS